MYKQSRLTRCLLALAMATSLVATVTVAPTSAANAASFGISAKKKVLTYEQKKAKYALTLAKKDLKTKEKGTTEYNDLYNEFKTWKSTAIKSVNNRINFVAMIQIWTTNLDQQSQ